MWVVHEFFLTLSTVGILSFLLKFPPANFLRWDGFLENMAKSLHLQLKGLFHLEEARNLWLCADDSVLSHLDKVTFNNELKCILSGSGLCRIIFQFCVNSFEFGKIFLW